MEDFKYQEENQYPEENQTTEQKEVIKQRFPFSHMGMFYFCILVGTNLISIIIMAVISFYVTITTAIQSGDSLNIIAITQKVSEIVVKNMTLVMIICYAITIPLCMLIAKAVPKYQHQSKEKWGISKLLLFLMLSIGLMMIGNIVSQIGQGLVTLITGHRMTNPLESILNQDNIIGSIVMVVIVAPFVEEFLFRKVLIDRVRVYGDKVTILLSGILFGLFHGNIFQVVYAMLLGMLLAYVYVKTSKISYCIGLHMAINIIGGALPLLLASSIDMSIINDMQLNELMSIAPQLMVMGLLLMAEIACMLATIVVIVKYKGKIKLAPGEIEIAKEERVKTIYLNTGMILFFAVCGLVFIMNAVG